MIDTLPDNSFLIFSLKKYNQPGSHYRYLCSGPEQQAKISPSFSGKVHKVVHVQKVETVSFPYTFIIYS